MERTRPDRIVRRITAEGVWTALSALHVGGDDRFDSNVDMALARDKAGEFYIPGASTAGACRSWLVRLSGYDDFVAGRERDVERSLFGAGLAPGSRIPVYASLLRFHEAAAEGDVRAPMVRDGVAIDPSTGNAKPKGKFNWQVLAAGTEFRIRIELLLYQELPYGIDEQGAQKLFRHLLEAFTADGVRLGARTRKGLGCGEVKQWEIRDFPMSDASCAADWLEGKGWTGGKLLALDDLDPTPAAPARDRLTIDAIFRLRGSLLVRHGTPEPNGPDFAQFSEAGVHWIPGTSIGGVFRHRLEKIANTLGVNGGALGQELFGYALGGKDKPAKEKAGRVSFSEARIDHGQKFVQSRVTIDRFTGGAVESRLFDEAPLWAAADSETLLRMRMTADALSPLELRLFVLTFKDLWLGDLPVGGESGVGRGFLEGVEATFHDASADGLPMVWRRAEGGTSVANLAAWRERLQE